MADRLKKAAASAVADRSQSQIATSRTSILQDEDDFYRDYTIDYDKKLGEGAFAIVHRCVRNADQEEFAVKLVDKKKVGSQQLQGFYEEVRILSGLDHPNLISLFGSYTGPDQVIIVMNYVVGGTLFDRILKIRYYTEEMAAEAMRNLLTGLEYLHQARIAHRDIKPENLLMVAKMEEGKSDSASLTNVLIADFGLATKEPIRGTCCGSPCYIAPEVILCGFPERYESKVEEYGTKCDIWSLGVVLYVMLSGRFPFAVPGNTRNALFSLIVKAEVRFHGDVWDTVSPQVKDFIRKLVTKDPAHRPSAAEALKDSWITGEYLNQLKPADSEHRKTKLVTSFMELEKFSMKRHVAAAFTVYKVAGSLFSSQRNADAQGPEAAFLKYIQPNFTNPFEHRIVVTSQTDASKAHIVNLGYFSRRLQGVNSATTSNAHRMTSVCTCTSVSVCRHVQYVYQWLFIGEPNSQVTPHLSDCEERRVDVKEGIDKSIDSVSWATAMLSLSSLALSYAAARCAPVHRVVAGASSKLLALISKKSDGAAGGSASAQEDSSSVSPWLCVLPAVAFVASLSKYFSSLQEYQTLRLELDEANDFILAAWKFKHAFDM
eukprot:gene14249-21852_t